MEPSDLEKQLNELEEKIDRLRALYEQYFMGIERLEPLIPRKDVDRRITLLRKEQMRNTALRFRFNTLTQRYNTMQQHWGRVVREIENGTYRRDVARAAARFGVDEALTAVGRKRAAGLMKVLEAQKGVEARRDAQKRKDSAEYEAVDAADLVEDDDDAPTPPPLDRGAGRQVTGQQPVARAASGGGHGEAGYDAARFAAPRVDEAAAERFGFAPPAAASRAGVDPSAMGFPEAAVPPPAVAHGGAASGGVRLNPTQAAAPGVAATGHGAPPGGEPATELPKKAPAGLRLGGGGPRRAADPDAARRRLEELAASIGATPSPEVAAPRVAPPDPQPRRRFDPDEIMSVGVPSSVPPPPRAAQPSQPERHAVLAPSDPSLDSSRRPAPAPLGLRPPSGRSSSPALDGGGGGPPVAATPAPSGALSVSPGGGPAGAATSGSAASGASAASGPSAADRAADKRAEVAAGAASRDLAEPRVREIYNQFIEAKRRSNESTASITYDKLADSLRKQVDKLKTEHRDRRIDFAVVTKDGKTMIKPIIK